MEFRLVLRGSLTPHKRGVVDIKHRIRQELHPQLRSFWQQHPLLRDRWTSEPGQRSLIEQYADKYARCGFRFVPLVADEGCVRLTSWFCAERSLIGCLPVRATSTGASRHC